MASKWTVVTVANVFTAAAATLLALLLPAYGRTAVRAGTEPAAGPVLPHPILFVTQVPWPWDFVTINATFGNHRASMDLAPRGGDLWIRYPDGALKNLTRAAGYGQDGAQLADAIVVRDPAVHWDGNKALFSMAIGAPAQQWGSVDVRFQIYEIVGLGKDDLPVVTRIERQPAAYNNVSPIYASDDRILFTSDRPRGGEPHLYPQRDEYELTPTVSGLWSLDPATGELRLLDHSPSGDFSPIVDSFGRVVFTRWDHLQRDQLADGDAVGSGCHSPGTTYGTFTWSDESAAAARLPSDASSEVFPEPRACRDDLLAGTNLAGHTFNSFFPWMMREDGSGLETLNHIGRHELADWLPRAITDDPAVIDFAGPGERANRNRLSSMFHIEEDPTRPGTYIGIDAPEFGSHASGQVVTLTGPPGLDADRMVVEYLSHRDTASITDSPSGNHSGLYRDPLVLADGRVLAAHTASTRQDQNVGSSLAPRSRHDYRLKLLAPIGNGYLGPGAALTPGIAANVGWWGPSGWTTHDGTLWELQPVALRSRPRPGGAAAALPAIERQVLLEAGVDPAALAAWLDSNQLALIVSRNVTTRDDQDRQQPFNLRVAGGAQTVGGAGKVHDVQYLQLFQADLLRGLTGCCSTTPQPGRRVLARPLHEPAATAANPPLANAPEGSVEVAPDGSLAAFVPARRALTWQLSGPAGESVVRERFWLTFQPGEIRVCASCHGVNQLSQAGLPEPTTRPVALARLLERWKTLPGSLRPVFADVPSGHWARRHIEAIHEAGISAGCALTPERLYCPDAAVRRGEMVVFLLRALHGAGYQPPDLPGTAFADVPGAHWAADWIQQAAVEGLSGGCGNGNFCPEAPVSRDQMAIFLLRAIHGPGHAPPPATGSRFADVPAGHWAAAWIEQLAAEGITGGCAASAYCPDAPVTRAQMAVFLVRAFTIPLD